MLSGAELIRAMADTLSNSDLDNEYECTQKLIAAGWSAELVIENYNAAVCMASIRQMHENRKKQ